MAPICRLCLKSDRVNNSYINVNQCDNTGVPVATLIKTLVPELYLGLSLHPVVCPSCHDALRDAYSFRLQCLRSENLIGIYIRETQCVSVTINLRDVMEYWRESYRTHSCQSEVAKANLAEWFGVDEQNNEANWANRRVEQKSSPEVDMSQLQQVDKAIGPDQLGEVEVPEQSVMSGGEEDNSETSPVNASENICINLIDNDDENEEPIVQLVDLENIQKEEEPMQCEEKPPETNEDLPKKPFEHLHEIDNLEKDMEPKQTEEAETQPVENTIEEDKPSSPVITDCLSEKSEEEKMLHEDDVMDASPIIDLKNPPSDCACPPNEYCPSHRKFWDLVPTRRKSVQIKLHRYCVVSCEYRHKADCPNRVNIIPPDVILPSLKRSYKSRKKYSTITLQTPKSGHVTLKLAKDLEDDAEIKKIIKEFTKPENFTKLNDKGAGSHEIYIVTKVVDITDNSWCYKLEAQWASKKGFCPKKTSKPGIINVKCHESKVEVINSKRSDELIRPDDSEGDVSSRPNKQGEEINGSGQSEEEERIENNENSNAIRLDLPESKEKGKVDYPPLIRVRPVSTLQNVRTLNYEITPNASKQNLQESAPPTLIRSTPPKYEILKLATNPPVDNQSDLPPVVLNSTLGINQSLLKLSQPPKSPPTLPSVLQPIKKYTNVRRLRVIAPRVVDKEIEPVDVKPCIEKLKAPPDSAQNPVNIDVGKDCAEVFLGAYGSKLVSLEDEDAIDIKEEPLDYEEIDLQNADDRMEVNSTDWELWDGETTRSASETSLLEKNNQDVSSLIEYISDIGDHEFDQPEYVHINSVSFADLSKLVKETKQLQKKQKESLQKSATEQQNFTFTVVPQMPVRNTINDNIKKIMEKLPPLAPKGKVPRKRGPYKSQERSRKRFKLIPVDSDTHRPTCKQSNVCVQFTNFSREGDYLNDHDYLVNPYTRNEIGGLNHVVCTLCNTRHPKDEHIEHMKTHGTRCDVCQVDFHNAIILNLHAKNYYYTCTECGNMVTYSTGRLHGQMHNENPYLSNIDLPPVSTEQVIQEKKECESKERRSPPGKLRRMRNSPESSSVRRSRRITRSNKQLDPVQPDDEEEACVYDKATKSFKTPTADKAQKLLAKSSNNNSGTTSARKEETKKNEELQTLTLYNLLKDSEIPTVDLTATFSEDRNISEATKEEPKKKRKRRQNKIIFQKLKKRKIKATDIIETVIDESEVQTKLNEDKSGETPASVPKRRKKGEEESGEIKKLEETEVLQVAGEMELSKATRRHNGQKSAASIKTIKIRNSQNVTCLKQVAKKVTKNKSNIVKKPTKNMTSKGEKLRLNLLTKSGQKSKVLVKKHRQTNLETNKKVDQESVDSSSHEDLSITIKDIKLNPFARPLGESESPEQVPEKSQIEEARDSRKSSAKKRQRHQNELTGTSLISNKDIKPLDIKMEVKSSSVMNSGSGTRSSRSRGSLNLVEGLKIEEPAWKRKTRKSEAHVSVTVEDICEKGNESEMDNKLENDTNANKETTRC